MKDTDNERYGRLEIRTMKALDDESDESCK